MAAIVPPARRLGEQSVEERGAWAQARLTSGSPRTLGHYGQQSGPGRGLQHEVSGAEPATPAPRAASWGGVENWSSATCSLTAPAVGQAKR